nr:MAG: anthranilate phosphoribosyltransferase [Hyphomicrobiales bacterium]
MSDELLTSVLKRLVAGETLSTEDATFVFATMMEGTVSHARIAAILTAMAMRGPAIEEIIGGARALRSHAVKVDVPDNAIDMCGTGGDNHGTLNVSTAASFVVAACGVPVAKHGNRAMSSRTGAADVLESLGVALNLKEGGIQSCFREAGLCFLFAQAHHPAMRHVGPVRKELGFRTIFNLLGPLSNPAGVRRQLLGVFDGAWTEPLAHTLQALGTEKAWVVHGSDGLDEITIAGTTSVAAVENGSVRTFEIMPEKAGLLRLPLNEIKGGTPDENASAIRATLDGAPGAFREIVLLNAAAALLIADKCENLRDGAQLAASAIENGSALQALDKLVAVSRSFAT